MFIVQIVQIVRLRNDKQTQK